MDTLAPETTSEPAGRPAAFALGPVAAASAGTVALLLAVSTRYGYHRDELYFLACARHMAWGFVDQPPLSIAFVWLSHALFGDSLVGLRLFPALADGGTVLLAGLVARELGGDRFAQSLAALAVGVSAFLVAGHLAGPTIYDLLGWAAVSLVVIRILRTGNERLWLAVGLVVGLGLLAKETILLLIAGLAVGFVANRQGRFLRSPWLWAGAGLALLMWSPNLIWEAAHGWPTSEMSRNLQREHSGLGYSLTFTPIQILLPGWWTAPVWMAGLWALWRQPRFRVYRAFAIAYALLFGVLIVVLGDRPYYLAGLYVVLLAAGAVVAGQVVAGARRFFSERPPRRRLIWRSRRAALGFVLILGLVDLPLALPILPARILHTVPLQNINYNLGETIGWPELAATVTRVYRSLPPDERAHAVILGSNYGEAGAIDRYGPDLGLPHAFSGHNSYWWWGPPPGATRSAVAIGFQRADLTWAFGSVVLAATIRNRPGVQNDEEGASVWICTDPRAPWSILWPDFKHYG